ncbi:ABC-F family ATP-binding cassette domain-containing protein [Alkalicoccus chagannorensis]|uniref:ABC-F family ATP-binding cassette domain-containing protein n=1 Tax=Alkalicoccus chagannorensis TaxID=427072 RepID=UPI0004147EEC|nr:ABC-F family ATP-binding cassette domain-containing protein [Alkalicoccus chagannorensis]
MILLQCSQLSKHFGSEQILANVKMEIKQRERIALVGRNGAGKSTLLKVFTGEMDYDEGQLMIPKDVQIGYLAQDSGLDSHRTIWEEMLTVFQDIRKMEQDLRRLEAQMAEGDHGKILEEYDALQQEFQQRGGFQYEADIRAILNGLHFSQFDFDTPISSLSGGQKTRLALGKLLLSRPDLLILDEPTNHLDIDTLTWLEQYLSSYEGSVLIVSHDRYFLDKVVTIVYELSFQRSRRFHGNYSRYLEEKAKVFDQEMSAFEKQQEERKQLEDFIQRNLARASTSNRAKSRRKKLEKMDVMERPSEDDKSASFRFDIQRQSGNDVLMLEDVALQYANQPPLLEQASLHVTRGESIALIGPNGAGKSTLLKAITGRLQTSAGNIRTGSNVTIGYYDQEQTELNSRKTVLHELWDEYPDVNEKDIRTVLGNFLFTGEEVLKYVFDLSGGEKARLALAKLMMQKANLLILDEPTNHLDLDSKEVLENALIDYPGTIIFVSHDRYFVNRMATRVVELQGQGLTSYLGDYDYYAGKKAEQAELARIEAESVAAAEPEPAAGGKNDFRRNKERQREERQRLRRIEELEEAIESAEKEETGIEDKLCDPAVFQDHEQAAELNQSLEEVQNRMMALMEEWEALQEE